MTTHKSNNDIVLAKYNNDPTNCRPAIAWLNINGKTESFYGFVVENEYFINAKTHDVYKKTDCVLINYIDDTDD
ncbi:MAG: hypothetical protein J5613_00070 [Alphaproteobacteria bacterium]|nr:hypothetical protein [Alphaproteobacteria bacterium]MBR4806372.1 hypothetical protein [Alphaproteobacteria bacterium]